MQMGGTKEVSMTIVTCTNIHNNLIIKSFSVIKSTLTERAWQSLV